jgi:hypothetical protein
MTAASITGCAVTGEGGKSGAGGCGFICPAISLKEKETDSGISTALKGLTTSGRTAVFSKSA